MLIEMVLTLNMSHVLQGGIKRQLADLTELVKFLDPDFYAYLDTR